MEVSWLLSKPHECHIQIVEMEFFASRERTHNDGQNKKYGGNNIYILHDKIPEKGRRLADHINGMVPQTSHLSRPI